MQTKKPKILFLFSDTGGGHRAAAEAIVEQIHRQWGDNIETDLVDAFTNHAPPPFNQFHKLYPHLQKMPAVWSAAYKLTDSRRRTDFLFDTLYPLAKRHAADLLKQYPCDLIVSTHDAYNALLRVQASLRPPIVKVVTDLVTTHSIWYDTRLDTVLVPTEAAKVEALKAGMATDKVKVAGFPISRSFCIPQGEKAALRAKLGWPTDLPMVLMMSGAEGVGLERTAQAIADSGLNVGLAVITGRNEKLKSKLDAKDWQLPAFIYGYVTELMPVMMQAADILISKAGSATLCEALASGLPVIIYNRLPGQEEGNVDYVVDQGAGAWAPGPVRVVATLKDWLEPGRLDVISGAAKAIAMPQSAEVTAKMIVGRLEEITKQQIGRV